MAFRRPQYLISLAFINSCIQGILIVVLSLIGKELLNAGPKVLGYYGFANGGVYVLCAVVSGRTSDRYGRRPTLTVGLVSLMLCCLSAIYIRDTWLFLIPNGLLGFAMGAIWPTVESGLCDGQTPAQTKRAMGAFNFAWLIAMVGGPVLGGDLFEVSPNLPLWISFIVIGIYLVLLYLPRTMEIGSWGEAEGTLPDEEVRPGKLTSFVWIAFIGNITAYFFISSFRQLLPEYTAPLGFAKWRHGLLIGAVYGGMFLGNAILMKMHRWHYSIKFLISVELCSVLLLVLFVLSDSYPVLVLIAVSLGFPAALTYFSSIYYGMAQLKSKGAHGGNHEAFIGVGSAVGPIFGGWLIARSGAPRANLVLCAVLWLVAMVPQILIYRRLSGGKKPDIPESRKNPS